MLLVKKYINRFEQNKHVPLSLSLVCCHLRLLRESPVDELVDGSWHHYCGRRDMFTSDGKCDVDFIVDREYSFIVSFDPCDQNIGMKALL